MEKSNASDTWFENASRMWQQNANVLAHLFETVDEEQYKKILNAVLACKGRVVTMGMGTSAVAARKIAHMFCVSNVPSFYVSPGDAAHGAFGAAQPGDLLIVLSKGGNTEELVNLIGSIKPKGITMAVVTQNADSKLAKAADMVLLMKAAESDHQHRLPTASIIAIISIFDAMADELTKYPQFSDEIFYLNHNHGAVGADLKSEREVKE